jgi:hypothetical protein
MENIEEYKNYKAEDVQFTEEEMDRRSGVTGVADWQGVRNCALHRLSQWDNAKSNEARDRELRIAINPHVIGKDIGALATHRHQFTPKTLSIAELARLIHEGYAFSNPITGEKHIASAFSGADVLVVDIDGGITSVEQVTESIWGSRAALWYTTPSHTKDAPRLRLVWVLPETEHNAEQYTRILRGLHSRLEETGIIVDRAYSDPCRVYFGSPGCQFGLRAIMLDPRTVKDLGKAQELPTPTATGDEPTYTEAQVTAVLRNIPDRGTHTRPLSYAEWFAICTGVIHGLDDDEDAAVRVLEQWSTCDRHGGFAALVWSVAGGSSGGVTTTMGTVHRFVQNLRNFGT